MTDSPKMDEKLDFKRILPIFVIVLVDILGLTIIIPLLPLYSAAFGANAFVIGILSATYPAMQFVASPILGSLSDRFGRKPVLVVSQIGTFAGFILLGFANALPILFISRMIDGVSGGNIATAKAAITDCTNEKTRTQGLGLIGAAFGIGFVIGPIISAVALLFANGNFHIPAFIAALFSLGSLLLTTFWFDETHQPNSGTTTTSKVSYLTKLSSFMSKPVIGSLLVLLFVQQLVLNGFEQLISVFSLNRLGLDGAGIAFLFGFMGILVAVVQGYAIGPLSRKYGEKRLIYGGMILLAIGLIGASFTPEQPLVGYSQADTLARIQTTDATMSIALPDDTNTGWLGISSLLLMLIPITIGGYLVMPSINSLLTLQTSDEEHGTILGISTSVMSMSHIIAPILSFALFGWFGSTVPLLIGGVLILVVMVALPMPFAARFTLMNDITPVVDGD